MSDFEKVFDKLTDLIDSIKDKSVTDRLSKARDMVLLASQQYLLGKTYNVDLTTLGITDDRKEGRRIGERRHNH